MQCTALGSTNAVHCDQLYLVAICDFVKAGLSCSITPYVVVDLKPRWLLSFVWQELLFNLTEMHMHMPCSPPLLSCNI